MVVGSNKRNRGFRGRTGDGKELRCAMARDKGQANFIQWIPLLLDALRALGGSAESREAADWIAQAVDLPPEEREKRNKNDILRFENQVKGFISVQKSSEFNQSCAGW